jgi:hypothetical protein
MSPLVEDRPCRPRAVEQEAVVASRHPAAQPEPEAAQPEPEAEQVEPEAEQVAHRFVEPKRLADHPSPSVILALIVP